MKEIAIKIQNLKKQYRIGTIGGTTLQRELQSRWAHFRGKEDPNQRIGTDARLIGETFWALDGINLTINQGEAVGIIGNNGAGKSTLLKLLSQVTAPTEGDIELYGRVASMLEVGTGFHSEMTGRENIYMNGAILGMTRTEIDAKLEQIIDFSEVREFIDTPVKRYSSGMFVKLAFSVAAHLSSEIMIMDEVLAVGDMAFQQKCLEKMRLAAEEEGRTVLYVSHNMETIRRLCRRCIVLDKGRVIFDGNTEEAIAVYMNHSIGTNEVDINLADVTHSGKKFPSAWKPQDDRKAKASRTIEKEYRAGTDGKGVFMDHLILLNKVTPVYDSTENLRLKVHFQVTKARQGVCFRLTLRTDSDVGIGTAWSGALNLTEGEHEKIFSMPLAGFAKGSFYGSVGFYYKDDLGRMIRLDHVTRAFRIEVTGSPAWYMSAYGCMRLPRLQVEE